MSKNKRRIALGDIIVEPDGSNLYPVAAYPVVERDTVFDDAGRQIHRVTFVRMTHAEERFYSADHVPCLRRVEVPELVTVVTDNSAVAQWVLLDNDQLLERKPRGDSYLDRLGYEDDFLLDDTKSEERRVAQTEALGAICRSVIEDFRPIVDENGNFMVSPFPVAVAKRD